MNFIEHLKNWLDHAEADDRLKPHHVSLYMALFRYWNQHRFRNPFTIFRHEIMAVSKIGSVNTYTKSLKELTEWNYISYLPSFNPQVGSRVHLYRFDKGSGKGGNKGTGKSTGKGAGNGGDKGGATYNINIPNTINFKNNINAFDTSHEDFGIDRKKQPAGGRRRRAVEATPGCVEDAQAYFLEIKSTQAEATKFYNHFQSNGWRVGGRAAMKDWRAAARNWVINAEKFANEHTSQPKPGKLNTGPKNYAEPL
jgi:hypothetical protein